jgi:membrane protein DedA with SNARE-associated domain
MLATDKLEIMAEGKTERRVIVANRLFAGVTSIVFTAAVGSIAGLLLYYPLRNDSSGSLWILVFVLMTGESAGIHLPSELILPMAGWLLVKQPGLGFIGLLEVSVLASCGNALGSTLLYGAGRYGGRPLVRRYGRYLQIHERDVDSLEVRLRKHRSSWLLVSRVLPVVRTYSGFVGGILRVPLPLFVLVTLLGSMIWSLLFVGVGLELGVHWSAARLPTEVAGTFVLAALLAGLIRLTVRQARATS